MRTIRTVWPPPFPALLITALAAFAPPAGADEVGRFALVQNQVTSLKPHTSDPVPAVPGAEIVLDEREDTGPASAAKITFGEWAFISIGQNTSFQVTRQAVAEATGESVSGIQLLAGKARVFVSRFFGGRPEVRVNTPTAVVGIKGSEVGIELLDDGGLIVTVVSGSAWVRPKAPGEERRDIGNFEELTVSPDGRPAGTPARITQDRIARLRRDTEPAPIAPRRLPAAPPTQDPPGPGGPIGGPAGWLATNTTATSSNGTVMANPPFTVAPTGALPILLLQGRSGQLPGPIQFISTP